MSMSDSLEGLKNFDINDLDFNNAGSWPAPIKAICILLLIALVLGAVYWFDIKDLDATLAATEQEEMELKSQFEIKAGQVSNLEEYKAQMVEMEKTFGALLRQLPSDTEVPGLLEDISSVGSLSGLELSSIDLQPELSREFYIELPIRIRLSGTYHDIAAFVSGVAGLPRIVTLHDFSITKAQQGVESLTMEIQAKTYRYSGGGDN
ncbi:type 4a pilus biogenesis protein PilO [Hahella ganghwensis]|uniref:type 4a pilus biogenesis protein PilO n=1 Tax=Hahella ganghwensis TaxID=286420 RepID=UPI000380410A|nr:type 4a pilus biogenesis protein PilO [Hahella ganghwensis]